MHLFSFTESVNNTGWIHIYDLAADNSSFSLSQSIQSPAGENSYFGASVAISDIEIIVGANGYRELLDLIFLTYGF